MSYVTAFVSDRLALDRVYRSTSIVLRTRVSPQLIILITNASGASSAFQTIDSMSRPR